MIAAKQPHRNQHNKREEFIDVQFVAVSYYGIQSGKFENVLFIYILQLFDIFDGPAKRSRKKFKKIYYLLRNTNSFLKIW